MEVMELPVKTHGVMGFAWEPKGSRFCVIHGEGPRHEVSFYNMEGASKAGVGQCTPVHTIKGKSTNSLFWSPAGKNIVLGTLGGSAGVLEFYNGESRGRRVRLCWFLGGDVLPGASSPRAPPLCQPRCPFHSLSCRLHSRSLRPTSACPFVLSRSLLATLCLPTPLYSSRPLFLTPLNPSFALPSARFMAPP